ncbi:alpha-L-fucosidase [Microbacterium sp. LTA6]|uniref:LPXTG cell wall anchor domain-containing protein n=1 Tax=unclassified Microbacterium TaxID=2609290 RepID=UPI00313904C8
MNTTTRVGRGRRLTALAAATAVVAALLGAGATNAATAATEAVSLPSSGAVEAPTVLMAASGEKSPGLTVRWETAQPKHFWVDGFTDSSRTVTWSVSTEVETSFRVDLLAAAQSGDDFVIDVAGGAGTRVTAPEAGWLRLDAGTITVPAGESTITAYRDGGSGDASIKSIELVSADAWAGFQERVADFKAAAIPTRTEFSKSGLGLMFQYGPWSYPTTGENPDIEAHTDAFDVEAFADLVESVGAGHVIWSVSWWTYQLQAPISSVDGVVGNGDRTASRDLIGELATELQSRGIMFMLYYHVGQDEHLGYNSTDFWQAQQFPNSFTPTGAGDRSTMIQNWKTIVGEIGERYGDKLDGWFFDDGLIYYPADFEELGNAARTGNPERLVSWNSWIAPSYTPFQDVVFGEEGCVQATPTGAAAPGGDGVMTSGKHAGSLEHCMERMEQDWGVHSADTTITPQHSVASLECAVAARVDRNAPVSLNLMMHFPGTPADSSMQVLEDLAASLGEPGSKINNDDPGIVYSEGQWGYSGNRNADDHCRDVSYTQTDGAFFDYAFDGTGIDVFGPTGETIKADVYIDGELVDSIDRTDGGYTSQVLLSSVTGLLAGEHTLRVVRTGGSYLQIDALSIRNEPLPAEATIAVSKPSVQAGAEVVVTGTGFTPGETVALELRSTPISLGSAVADADGKINVAVRVPATAPVGAHMLYALRTQPAGEVGVALEVTAAADGGGNGGTDPGGADPGTPATPGSGLAATGADAPIIAVLAALVLAAAGGVLLVRRRVTGRSPR